MRKKQKALFLYTFIYGCLCFLNFLKKEKKEKNTILNKNFIFVYINFFLKAELEQKGTDAEQVRTELE
ncbi:hypothetical protein [Tenacibaculum piscium]|uniref:hypothetical protein n=1 Tax=Tenacibaculum piscium TaxID=1458515 RepID=UPI001F32354E|nr:hypothetical protein [Tenacibaculum piscium]